ncbi:MAG: helix-turn-helix transcriptional regulator [Eubacterium sp.]|nr:helix-turn-helix transcriptional regulator [Eubacterium sp.]
MNTTNDLMEVLNDTQTNENLDIYLEDIEKYKDIHYQDYFESIREQHGVSKNELAHESGISRTYCYQILNGTRRPGRDNAIALCIAAHFNLPETIRFLEILKLGILYPKDQRDSIIIFSINRGFSVQETNELLYSKKEAILGE